MGAHPEMGALPTPRLVQWNDVTLRGREVFLPGLRAGSRDRGVLCIADANRTSPSSKPLRRTAPAKPMTSPAKA